MKSGINATKVGQIETNKNAIATANGNITKNTNAINTINNSDVMKSGINATKVGQIETNRLAIVTANGEIEKNKTAINTINNSAVMKSGINSTIVQQVGTNKTGITTVNGRVDTLEESVNGLSGSVNTLEGNVNNNTASINNISTDVNAMKTGKQDKLVAGSGITIASDGKTISANSEKPWIPIENLNDITSLFQMSDTYPINWTLLKKIRLKINVIIGATYSSDVSCFFRTTNTILPFTWNMEEYHEKHSIISLGIDTFGYVAKSEKPGLCSIYMRLNGNTSSSTRGIYFYLSITGQDQLFKIFKISPDGSITTYERITYDTNLPAPNNFSHNSTYPEVRFCFEYQD